jgi:hypothetical protein
MLAGLQDTDDEGRQLSSLQELNVLLTMGSGHFKVGEIIPILVKLFRTSRNAEIVSPMHRFGSWELGVSQARDEQVLLICRALNTIIDIHPRAGRSHARAIPSMCERLVNMQDIDVAEQCMKW